MAKKEAVYASLKLCVLKETDRAYLMFDPDRQDETQAVWIPISQTKTEGNITSINGYDCVEIEVAEWIAIREGLV